ncbi:MAG: LEA type 2 family protein [Halopseudomonas sp.]|uniref:LEA type 2 family protein n=1 Tax=Halopseudomonas sp. TaxID=2901191 RepID=UPI00300379EE
MKSRVLGMLVLLPCLFLQGCAMLMPSYNKPDVRLANVEMLKSNLWEQSFRLQLRVDNPNSKPLPIRGMQYQVYLNDTRLATGVSNNRFDVPAYGSETFELEVRSNLWRHLADLVKLVEKQQAVDYRIEGHISTGLFLAPNIHLKEKGTLDPSQLSF